MKQYFTFALVFFCFGLPTIHSQTKTVSKTFSYEDCLPRIIPDGNLSSIDSNGNIIFSTPDSLPRKYESSITFFEFKPNSTLASAADIRSICLNFCHSYLGDLNITIECPSGAKSTLKYGKNCIGTTSDPYAPADSPDGPSGGGNEDAGVVFDPRNTEDPAHAGIGMDYCWSRNNNYTLINGENADVVTRSESQYISTCNSTITDTFEFPDLEFKKITLRTPSNYAEKTDYYRPSGDFEELVGCPLNGEWKMTIIDFWPGDNGWVFSWAMDLQYNATQSISEVSADHTLAVKGHDIMVNGALRQRVLISDISGRVLVDENAVEGKTYRMPNTGIYLVKVGNHSAQKVVIQ